VRGAWARIKLTGHLTVRSLHNRDISGGTCWAVTALQLGREGGQAGHAEQRGPLLLCHSPRGSRHVPACS
jgi:hypothetical protein